MNLPLFIDPLAWNEYSSMRKRIKKPLTELSAQRLLNRCNELQAKGWDANESLRVAADCCWLSVYPHNKDMSIPDRNAATTQTNAFFADMEKAKREATRPPERILRMVGKA
jgi:hypothetical protein